MKTFFVLLLVSIASTTPTKGAPVENDSEAIAFVTLSHRIETIAKAIKADTAILFFIEDETLRTRTYANFHFPWLKSPKDFSKDKQGNFILTSDRTTAGCALYVTKIEITGELAYCILGQYFGPLGAERFKYSLKKTGGKWIVLEASPDRHLVS